MMEVSRVDFSLLTKNKTEQDERRKKKDKRKERR